MLVKTILAASFAFAVMTAGAAEVVLDPGHSARSWNFINGGEFPGAAGGISFDSPVPVGRYSFAGGGRYVGFEPKIKVPAGLGSLIFSVTADADVSLSMRMVDRNGRTYQTHSRRLKGGETHQLVYPVAGPWNNRWGGSSDAKVPEQPLRSFYLMANRVDGIPLSGTLRFEKISGIYEQVPAADFHGEDFSGTLAGWKIDAAWGVLANATRLTLKAAGGGAPAELEVIFPTTSRDLVTREKLLPGKAVTLEYLPPFADLGKPNLRNVYRIRLRVVAASGEVGETVLLLKGAESGAVNLGAPRKSSEIAASKLGTCVHFSYGKDPKGAFRVWNPYVKILDEIAESGYKWIRTGVGMQKDDKGKLSGVEPYDLEWLRAARERGLECVLVIGMYADEPVGEFIRRCELVVAATRDMVRVYELGNEPANFGGWIKKHGGTWNGRSKDGLTHAPWLIAHLDYTNQGAERIKQLYPEATVIGCGNVTPANFRDLDLGLSAAVDGVVDHLYTFSMPPEKVPYGHGLTARDGVQVGDADSTFAGLIGSYIDKFKAMNKSRSIWITEFGYSNFYANGENEEKLYAGFSEEAQSVYIVRRFLESLALPIALTCQYEFLDDYGSKPFQDEANFGVLRTDYSRKPLFYSIQRLTSLMSGAEPDPTAQVTVTAAPLHRSAIRDTLVKSWDDAAIGAANGVRAYAFSDPANPGERLLALWSMQPYSREFNNRVVSLEISGWESFTQPPVAIDLICGDTYDLPLKQRDGTLVLEKISLKNNPLLIKFFK